MLDRQAAGDPCRQIAGDLREHALADARGDLVVGKGRREGARGDDPPIGHDHARQGFETDDLGRVEPDHGLVVGQDPVFRQRLVHLADGFDPLHDRRPQAGVEGDVAAAVGLLGMVEREIGVLPQRFGVASVRTVDDAAERDLRHHHVAVALEGRAHALADRVGDLRELVMVSAAIADHRELVAAQPVGGTDARGVAVAQALGHLADQPVADHVAHGIVDRLQMVDVDEDQREARRGAERQRGDRLVETAAIGQVRQLVEIGKVMVVLLHLRVRDGDRAQMHAGIDDLALERAWSALDRIIEGEGRGHAAGGIADRARPAGPQTQRQGKPGKAGPERIGGDVGNLHRLALERRAAAGADAGADLQAVQRLAVMRRQRRGGQRVQLAVLIDEENGAGHAGRQNFDARAQQVGDDVELRTQGNRLEDFGLQLLQREMTVCPHRVHPSCAQTAPCGPVR